MRSLPAKLFEFFLDFNLGALRHVGDLDAILEHRQMAPEQLITAQRCAAFELVLTGRLPFAVEHRLSLLAAIGDPNDPGEHVVSIDLRALDALRLGGINLSTDFCDRQQLRTFHVRRMFAIARADSRLRCVEVSQVLNDKLRLLWGESCHTLIFHNQVVVTDTLAPIRGCLGASATLANVPDGPLRTLELFGDRAVPATVVAMQLKDQPHILVGELRILV